VPDGGRLVGVDGARARETATPSGVAILIVSVGLVLGAAGAVGSKEADAPEPRRDLEEARALVRAGDLPSAQSRLEAYVERIPDSAEGWLTLGLVRFALRQFDAAAIAAVRSVELDGAQPRAFKLLGRIQTARKRPGLAERAFVGAARLDPQDPEARYLLGRLYQSEDRLVDAARFLKEAVELDPGSVRAHAFLGTVYYALGETSQAGESLRRAVALNQASKTPESIPHLEYGIYLLRTNRPEESATQLRRAAQLDPSSVEARFELGRALHRMGRLDEAGEALRAALAVDETDARVHYLLGRVCYEQGDRECGDEHMRRSEDQRGH
jgi:protein O-GlcNAc transferase